MNLNSHFINRDHRFVHRASCCCNDDSVQEIYQLTEILSTPMQSQCNLLSLDVFKDDIPQVPRKTMMSVRSDEVVLLFVPMYLDVIWRTRHFPGGLPYPGGSPAFNCCFPMENSHFWTPGTLDGYLERIKMALSMALPCIGM